MEIQSFYDFIPNYIFKIEEEHSILETIVMQVIPLQCTCYHCIAIGTIALQYEVKSLMSLHIW